MNLAAVEEMLAVHRRENRKTFSLNACSKRLAFACAVPLGAAAWLVTMAAGHKHVVSAAERATRAVIMGTCDAVAVITILFTLLIFVPHWRRRLEVGNDNLVIHDLFGSRRYDWGQVTVGFPRGRNGMREVTLGTPDGTTTISEAIYPSLQEGYGLMSERAAAARRGVLH